VNRDIAPALRAIAAGGLLSGGDPASHRAYRVLSTLFKPSSIWRRTSSNSMCGSSATGPSLSTMC